ncbi:PREDICTED: translational activator of cytochrome c oxidase 1 [Pseudopodoces humilis]|uniref:translational activator of cytochrome c oxidase 1 n=1 Tax=Pseudopodoces humilis TaxID=181119 RepID=UPI0006B85A90|nr:PREDICTED: translational activator of cytochrome c oxidase 1 [Pseudopodoces humilis]
MSAALGLRLPRLLGQPRASIWGSPGLPPRLPGLLPGLPAGPGRAMAGHNRWSKVRNVKGPRDAERSRLFQRMAQLLRAAARGERPAAGSRLLLGVRGPGGSALLLDVLTDNVRRSQAELRTLLARHGSSLAEGVQHSFQAVGVVRVSGQAVAMEAALEAAAVAGAQDVVAEDEDELKFLCDPSALGSVRQGLEAAGLRPLSAAVEFQPRSPLTLAEGPRTAAGRLLDALAERPDIVRLFHDIDQWPEDAGGHSGDGQSSGHSGGA